MNHSAAKKSNRAKHGLQLVFAILSILLFLIIFSAGILYTFNQNKIYRAVGLLEILDSEPKVYIRLEDLTDRELAEKLPAALPQESSEATHAEHMRTQLAILSSQSIARAVDQRLQREMRQRFMAPFLGLRPGGPRTPQELLVEYAKFKQVDQSRIVRVSYDHPDPILAAEIANVFMEEFINFQLETEVDAYMRITEDLQRLLAANAKTIEQMSKAYAEALASGSTESNKTDTLRQQLESAQTFFGILESAQVEARSLVSLATPHARIIDNPMPPIDPVGPNTLVYLSVSGTAAFFASTLLFSLGHRWSQRTAGARPSTNSGP